MKKILIFSGTTEGRELSEILAQNSIAHGVSVATEYGELVMQESPFVTLYQGRMDKEAMTSLIRNEYYEIVIDATHPYAIEVTKSIRAAVDCMDSFEVLYLRLEREIENLSAEASQKIFSSNEEIASYLTSRSGNILLTTGSKELPIYCKEESLRQRLFVRVLPSEESIAICAKCGLKPNQVIAMQGPFSVEMNLAMLKEYDISYLVTKQAGKAGGFEEKCIAAKEAGVEFLVVKPEELSETSTGYSMQEILEILEEELLVEIYYQPQENLENQGLDEIVERQVQPQDVLVDSHYNYNIVLAGAGLGTCDTVTMQVKNAISNADVLIGAKRVIEPWKQEKKTIVESYLPDEIASWLISHKQDAKLQNIVILFSGDSGFYSGCQKTKEAIEAAMKDGFFTASVQILPGISSIQAMAVAVGESWTKFYIYSIHGRGSDAWQEELTTIVDAHCYTFVLVSGLDDVRQIGRLFATTGLDEMQQIGQLSAASGQKTGQIEIWVGYQLSYPEQSIQKLSPEDCITFEKEGLYSLVIWNHHPNEIVNQKFNGSSQKIHNTQKVHNVSSTSHGFASLPHYKDEKFLRGKVPMTKEEVRHLSVCKLGLQPDSTIYDIGSGTGSVAVEIAGLSKEIAVYAIERKPEAVDLIRQNCKQFDLENIQICEGEALALLDDLPVPTHAFIGGSGGELFAILEKLQEKNRAMRVVINAVSVETVSQIQKISEKFAVKDFELIQMQTSRYQSVGNYLMPKAENPIFICSFEFAEECHE